MTFKKDNLSIITDTLRTLQLDKHLAQFISPWLATAEELTEKLDRLLIAVARKQHEIKNMSTSISQYEEDYLELNKWLSEKEEQFEQLSQQNLSGRYHPRLLDKCKVSWFSFLPNFFYVYYYYIASVKMIYIIIQVSVTY